jgi:5-oxoprolinase (ATP-hydrolysing)
LLWPARCNCSPACHTPPSIPHIPTLPPPLQGYDVTQHVLACFGGAGGQHACAIAAALGMRTIFVHRFSGILSAVGIGLAEVVQEAQEPAAAELSPSAVPDLEARLDALQAAAEGRLAAKGFAAAQVSSQRYLNLRYDGTDVPIMTPCPQDGDYAAAFERAYKREFGFTLEQRAILVDDVRVRASGRHVELPEAGQISQDPGRLRVWVAGRLPPAPKHQVAACLAGAWRPAAPIPLTPIARLSAGPLPAPAATASAYFEAGGRQPTPAYLLPELSPGHAVPGGRQVACAASGRPAVPRPRSLQGRGNARALLHQSQSHMHAPPHTCPSSAHQQAQLTRLLCKLQAQPCS